MHWDNITPRFLRMLARWRGTTVAILGLLVFHVPSACAQEVQWRHDYAQARREAAERDKPLLLDFGTEYCVWCKRLDATTFRDPAVVATINDKFVPLKIDAGRDPSLSDILKIQSYPTLVLAGPDGKILTSLEGYQDAAQLYEQMRRVLAVSQTPEWMARDYQLAASAVASSDFPRAVALLKPIIEDGQDRSVQAKARQLLGDLEKQAGARLVSAKLQEQKGQMPEAVAALTETQRLYAGTRAAVDAGQLLANISVRPEYKNQIRSQRAIELLAQARDDYRTQQFTCCLERCETIVANYPDLSEATLAQQLADDIKANPEWLQQACESLSDRLGGLYLALAESWIKKGDPQQAIASLERVVQTFPGTKQAETAIVRLGQIQGSGKMPVDGKK